MKQLPTSSGNDDNSDGPVGKTTTAELRTKSKEDVQVPPSIPSTQSKGKGPKIKFTIKGSKKGESSSVVQETQIKEPEQQALEETEKEKEQDEGEIPVNGKHRLKKQLIKVRAILPPLHKYQFLHRLLFILFNLI